MANLHFKIEIRKMRSVGLGRAGPAYPRRRYVGMYLLPSVDSYLHIVSILLLRVVLWAGIDKKIGLCFFKFFRDWSLEVST